MTGKIENFKGGSRGPRIIGSSEVSSGPPRTLDSKTKQEQEPIEVRSHEEIILEGDNRIRMKKSGVADLRFRAAKDRAEWDRIKRLEDE